MAEHDHAAKTQSVWRYHLERNDWLVTPEGKPRGYIQPHTLRELWFHTGTRCNLGCGFCLEGAGPREDRIDLLTFDDARGFIDEAVALDVDQLSFTGGEPFVNPDIVRMLDYALDHRPCLVLTNATAPLRKQFDAIRALADKPNRLRFRVSLDYPDPVRHDANRGAGSFALALRTMRDLHAVGFAISIARHREAGENSAEVAAGYQAIFRQIGLPADTTIISFPELYPPGDHADTPDITENCMTTYKDETSRAEFMCAFSKMVVKIDGRVGVYACTLVDDDPDYDLGSTLTESMDVRVILRHHRCFSCFSAGTSCSE